MLIKNKFYSLIVLPYLAILLMFGGQVWAQTSKPNILIIWGDDVGMWNISAYHRGMMGGTTPNIDRIADKGMIFMDHYAQASCTAGRAAFLLGQYPMRTGLSSVGLAVQTAELPAYVGREFEEYLRCGYHRNPVHPHYRSSGKCSKNVHSQTQLVYLIRPARVGLSEKADLS
jgi:hypothetical protein